MKLDNVKYLQITAPISPGSSGGAVFTGQGRVIGIATAAFTSGQNLNFALPLNLLKDLPLSNVQFAAIKHVGRDSVEARGPRELVFVNNIIEKTAGYTLEGLTVSIQNQSSDTIGNFRILVVVKSPSGDILNFHMTELKDTVVPPKLARQVGLLAHAQGFQTFDFKTRTVSKGSYEIRILDYRIVRRGGGPIDELFKR